jgi:cytochrome P450
VTATTNDTLFYDPTDPETMRNPHPIFERLREEAPLYHHESQDFYAVSRFQDVEDVLVNRDVYVSRRGVTLQILRSGMEFPGTLIFEDPPSHTIHRALLSRMFTNRRVSGLEDEIRNLCVGLMDPLVGSGGFDFISEVAAEVPMRVIGMLVGIPEADQVAFRDHVHSARDNTELSLEEAMSGSTFGPYMDWRIEHPSDDIMTHLLNAEFEDENGEMTKLTREQLLAYTNIVASAGNETTQTLIGFAAQLLGDHPGERRKLVEDPSLIPSAVEETVRFEPNTLHNCRFVSQDIELYGETVPAGSFMVTLTPSANRDRRRFDDPHTYDVTRKIDHHMSFGFGAHYCLGQALARLEARVVLEEMLKRFPEWHVDHDGTEFFAHDDSRGWDRLPLVIP